MKTEEEFIKTIIIDEDKQACNRMEDLLAKSGNVSNLTSLNDASEAVDIVKEMKPHLIFIEIEMGKKNGFDIIREIRKEDIPVEIAIVSAYKQYAIKALKYGVFDFILKPVDLDELKLTIERLFRRLVDKGEIKHQSVPQNAAKFLEKQSANLPTQKRIRINTKDGLIFRDSGEILYFEADGANTSALLAAGECIRSKDYLSVVEKFLPASQFLRISRFHIINLDRLKKVDVKSKHVILFDKNEDIRLKVTRKYYKMLSEM